MSSKGKMSRWKKAISIILVGGWIFFLVSGSWQSPETMGLFAWVTFGIICFIIFILAIKDE